MGIVIGYIANTMPADDAMDSILQTTFSNAIFFNENIWISIRISPKFVPKNPINIMPAFVQIMAWCRLGDEPLTEPMMVKLWRIYASLGLNELTGTILLEYCVFSIREVKWSSKL